MGKQGRDRRPYLRPVTNIQLSEENMKLRWILLVLFLSIAVVAMGMGFYHALSTEPGWNTVTVSSQKVNCGSDFILMYDFSDYGSNASAANKQIQSIYSKAAEDGYALFSYDAQDAVSGNVYYVNQNVNNTITVNEELYEAFALLESNGIRYHYMAPIYGEYNSAIYSEEDIFAREYDPMYNSEAKAYVTALCEFVNDPAHIQLELLGNNQLKLHVSEAYIAFAQDYGIEVFVDLQWMTNAFLIDYLADALLDAGFTSGYLASYDGFTRNLDTRGYEYAYNLFDRRGNDIYIPGELRYDAPMSIVCLRNYPLSERDRWHYYTYENGDITTIFLDSEDGVSKSSTDNIVVYGQQQSCAQLLMQIAPVFIAETFDQSMLSTLEEENVYAIWAEDNMLCYNQEDAKVNLLAESGGENYQLKYIR